MAEPARGGIPCPGLFCEDFESGQLDPTVWDVKASGSQTVTVQTKTVAHGKYAARFHGNPNMLSYDFIITKDAPAALQGHHFGRAYFYVSPGVPTGHIEFLFAGTKGFPKVKYLEVAETGSEWQLTWVNLVPPDGASVGSGPATQEQYSIGGTVPFGQWMCLEWEFNDAPDQARVFVNGALSYAFTNISNNGVSTGLVGGFSDFGFGYYDWHPTSSTFDLYYDDIVLDTKRVGCL